MRPHPLALRFTDIGQRLFGVMATAPIAYLTSQDRIKVSRHFKCNQVCFEEEGEPPYIEAVKLRPSCPDPTLAHEFGHVMHCWLWPDLSSPLGVDRPDGPGEAVANFVQRAFLLGRSVNSHGIRHMKELLLGTQTG